jgi:hypothetical protein
LDSADWLYTRLIASEPLPIGMSDRADSESFSPAVAALLVLIPIVGGGLLLVLFEDSAIHRLGLFLLGGGVIVGLALILVQRERV